jgi:transposase
VSLRIPRLLAQLFAPSTLRLTSVAVDETNVLVKARASRLSAYCPKCHHRSRSIQSTYVRRLHDLPILGLNVSIEIQTRRFWCKQPGCSQKIFSLPLDGLAKKYARATERRDTVLGTLGRFLGGRPAARASQSLGVPTSRATTLRRLRSLPLEIPPISPFVGIDDFSFKKGHRYGTIVVDLPSHRVVDLLPDRESTTVADWMKSHPHVEVVSRDRSGSYADAVNTGAPQALQVADRFHLLKNVTDALKRVIESKHRLCSTVAKEAIVIIRDDNRKECEEQTEAIPEQSVNDPTTTIEPSMLTDFVPNSSILEIGAFPVVLDEATVAESLGSNLTSMEPKPTKAQQDSENRRERRLSRYEEVMELRRKGFGFRAIASIVGLARQTVRSWINRGDFPERAPQMRRHPLLDEWTAQINTLHEQGIVKATAIFQELRKAGYRGSYTSIKNYCRNRWKRPELNREHASSIPSSWRSPRSITWSLISDQINMNKNDRKFFDLLCARDEELRLAVKAARDFASLVRTKGHALLTAWIKDAKATLLAPFAQTIERDEACVRAAMREPWSQGCVEGNVNRLKVIKRQMYGRGKFDLLRRRVLLKA